MVKKTFVQQYFLYICEPSFGIFRYYSVWNIFFIVSCREDLKITLKHVLWTLVLQWRLSEPNKYAVADQGEGFQGLETPLHLDDQCIWIGPYSWNPTFVLGWEPHFWKLLDQPLSTYTLVITITMRILKKINMGLKKKNVPSQP